MINMTISKILKLLIILLINQLEVEYYGIIHLNLSVSGFHNKSCYDAFNAIYICVHCTDCEDIKQQTLSINHFWTF